MLRLPNRRDAREIGAAKFTHLAGELASCPRRAGMRSSLRRGAPVKKKPIAWCRGSKPKALSKIACLIFCFVYFRCGGGKFRSGEKEICGSTPVTGASPDVVLIPRPPSPLATEDHLVHMWRGCYSPRPTGESPQSYF